MKAKCLSARIIFSKRGNTYRFSLKVLLQRLLKPTRFSQSVVRVLLRSPNPEVFQILNICSFTPQTLGVEGICILGSTEHHQRGSGGKQGLKHWSASLGAAPKQRLQMRKMVGYTHTHPSPYCTMAGAVAKTH